MKTHDATEQAYKNGYSKGFEDGKRDAVKHGRWINGIGSYSTANCSVCDWKIPYTEDYYAYLGKTNYCPNCGADMRGEKDD